MHSRTFVCLFAHPGGAFKAVGFLAGDVAPVSRKQVRYFHRAAINIGAATCTADTASPGVQSKSRGVLYTTGENKMGSKPSRRHSLRILRIPRRRGVSQSSPPPLPFQ